MKKCIIAVWGESSQGKSSSLREIWNEIKRTFVVTNETIYSNSGDFTVIFNIGQVKVGMESQGDPPGNRLGRSLTLFSKENCQLIICTTRTRGNTVELVNAMSPPYDIIWTSNFFSNEKSHSALNELYAVNIVNLIDLLIKKRV